MTALLLFLGLAALAVAAVVAWATLRHPLVPVIGVVLVLPFGTHSLLGTSVAQVVSAAAVMAVALIAVAERRSIIPRQPMLLWASALVAAGFLSVHDAVDPGASLRECLHYAAGVTLTWAVVYAIGTVGQVRVVATTLSVVGAAVALTTLGSIGQLQAAQSGNVVVGRATGIFSQPNELGSFCAVVTLLAVGTAFAHQRRALRRLCLLAAAASTVGLVLSLSRGAWIGTAAGVLLLTWLIPQLRRKVLGALVLISIAGACLMLIPTTASIASILVARLDSITSPTNPYDDRPAIWAEATHQFLEHPLFGVGPSGYTAASVVEKSVLHARPAEHAHNLLLVMASEQGILGIVLLFGVIVSGVFGAVRLLRRQAREAIAAEQPLLAGICAALLSVLGQGMIDFPLRNPVAGTSVWLVVGLLAALFSLGEKSRSRTADAHQGLAVPVA